jgi:hypothetical protein
LVLQPTKILEIMIKKSFALIASLLLLSSSLNANNIEEEEINGDCFDRATIIMHQADAAGYSTEEVTWYMNVAYALCMGYSLDDIQN